MNKSLRITRCLDCNYESCNISTYNKCKLCDGRLETIAEEEIR